MIGMIQLLVDGVSPIHVFAFGSNNRHTAIDVHRRLLYVKEKLTAFGITLLGYATDGDSREMKVMRIQNRLGVALSSEETAAFASVLSTSQPGPHPLDHPHTLRIEIPFFLL